MNDILCCTASRKQPTKLPTILYDDGDTSLKRGPTLPKIELPKIELPKQLSMPKLTKQLSILPWTSAAFKNAIREYDWEEATKMAQTDVQREVCAATRLHRRRTSSSRLVLSTTRPAPTHFDAGCEGKHGARRRNAAAEGGWQVGCGAGVVGPGSYQDPIPRR